MTDLAEHLTYPDRLQGASLSMAQGHSPRELGIEPRWHIVHESITLGSTKRDFDRAADNLLSFRAHAHAGVKVVAGEGGIVTLRFMGTSSPCLILRRERSEHSAYLVYGTLPGHVECGEEAFVVQRGADGEVVGRCVAFSRPAWWAARLAPAVARMVQHEVTRRYLRGMAR